MSEYKSQLIRVLNNKHLDTDNLSVLVIYNMKGESKEKLAWIDKKVLDNKMNLKKIFEDFPNVKYDSKTVDVNSVIVNENEMEEIITDYCENFSEE